jgi:tRNA(Phe) wybutosine-synthesizing methylase Tyw3
LTHFPDLWENDLHDGLRNYLEQSSCSGRQVFGMEEPGDVYEFIFTFHNRRLYAKLNLTKNGELVIVYSAHPPLKGNTL